MKVNSKSVCPKAILCGLVISFSSLTVSADHGYPQYAGSSYGYKYHNQKAACIPYELHARGGEAGIRFMHNIGNYKLVKHGVIKGRLCGTGKYTVELSKRHPYTDVILKINGHRYHFYGGEPADRYIKHWYRKYVDLHIPYYDYGHRYSNGTVHGHIKKHYKPKKHYKRKRHHLKHGHGYYGYRHHKNDHYYYGHDYRSYSQKGR